MVFVIYKGFPLFISPWELKYSKGKCGETYKICRWLICNGLQQCVLFSRIEAAASTQFFQNVLLLFEGLLTISGPVIWYQLRVYFASCHCIKSYLLSYTGLYLLYFLIDCGLYLRAASIRENTVFSKKK